MFKTHHYVINLCVNERSFCIKSTKTTENAQNLKKKNERGLFVKISTQNRCRLGGNDLVHSILAIFHKCLTKMNVLQ